MPKSGSKASRVPTARASGERLQGRLSPAPDVRAALAQVEGKSDVVGVVYRTDYMAYQGKVKLIYQVPSDKVNITYVVAVLKASGQPKLAEEFVEYLFSPKARDLLAQDGFIVE